MALTDLTIRNAKPRPKPYKMGDSGGLFLQVTPSGGGSSGGSNTVSLARKSC
jgi:hypothetical protein